MTISEQIKDYLKYYSVGCAEAQAEKNGLLTALKIAEAHESEYGWQPIETAPVGRVFIRNIDGIVYLASRDDIYNEYYRVPNQTLVIATQWYRFEEETK